MYVCMYVCMYVFFFLFFILGRYTMFIWKFTRVTRAVQKACLHTNYAFVISKKSRKFTKQFREVKYN